MDEAPTKWNVTFTKHLKQKRKVYRDGFLSLHSSSAKVMLYDDSDQLLECRILKNDEVVCSGETLTFNAYLVDVGEPEGGQKPLDDTYACSRENKVPKRTNLLHRNKFVNVSDCAGIVCSYIFVFLNAGVSVGLKINDSCSYVCNVVPIIYLYYRIIDSAFFSRR
ncbi:hypothetical protein EUGRSUZ_E00912 [Eucalyptus grandis]|uniref:5'-3' DNA helicase ZGRF1-like N-terminal domain-containing protein n=2 Tax=Eucalyptus grandis TaxID=71139 RepID=A0A059C2R8_EUCGR|nr:hypothetical protein EUGRSUZ_E00912 [Eucalyptus grandis]